MTKKTPLMTYSTDAMKTQHSLLRFLLLYNFHQEIHTQEFQNMETKTRRNFANLNQQVCENIYIHTHPGVLVCAKMDAPVVHYYVHLVQSMPRFKGKEARRKNQKKVKDRKQ